MDNMQNVDFLNYLSCDEEKGIHRSDRQIFTDPDIFELEMKYVFEKSWLYLCHESQLKNPNDFFTVQMGRQPVIVTRDKDGELHGFINACSHRGAQLINTTCGNARTLVCPFHAWCFDTKGTLLDCGESKGNVGYSDHFSKDDLGLQPIGHIESYRGFVFGTLDDDACTLQEHLGDSTHMIDMLVDQSDEGLEVVPGATSYTYNGNWKLQAENGVDGFHLEAIHGNYVMTIVNRQKIQGAKDKVKPVDVAAIASGKSKLANGYYDFGHGHVVLWAEADGAGTAHRPLHISGRVSELEERYGALTAKFMGDFFRNLCLYPNVLLMDQMSTQIRRFNPISVDKTEVTTYCIAPIGESDKARERRLRQYEDFFNATGMATPDDLTAFNNSQIGFMGSKSHWSDMSRGARNLINGPDQLAKGLGITPLVTGSNFEDEGLMVAQHKHWAYLMNKSQQEE